MFSAEDFLQILNNYREFAILISIGISILIAISGIIPSVFVTGANLLFFGTFFGIFISVIGETIGAVITYYLYKKGFKKSAERLGDKYGLLGKIVNSKGIEAGLFIFQGRLIPFIPSGFITLAGSVSNVNIYIFAIATFLGKIPSIVLEGLISYGVLKQGVMAIKFVITIIGTYFIIRFFKVKKQKNN